MQQTNFSAFFQTGLTGSANTGNTDIGTTADIPLLNLAPGDLLRVFVQGRLTNNSGGPASNPTLLFRVTGGSDLYVAGFAIANGDVVKFSTDILLTVDAGGFGPSPFRLIADTPAGAYVQMTNNTAIDGTTPDTFQLYLAADQDSQDYQIHAVYFTRIRAGIS